MYDDIVWRSVIIANKWRHRGDEAAVVWRRVKYLASLKRNQHTFDAETAISQHRTNDFLRKRQNSFPKICRLALMMTVFNEMI